VWHIDGFNSLYGDVAMTDDRFETVLHRFNSLLEM